MGTIAWRSGHDRLAIGLRLQGDRASIIGLPWMAPLMRRSVMIGPRSRDDQATIARQSWFLRERTPAVRLLSWWRSCAPDDSLSSFVRWQSNRPNEMRFRPFDEDHDRPCILMKTTIVIEDRWARMMIGRFRSFHVSPIKPSLKCPFRARVKSLIAWTRVHAIDAARSLRTPRDAATCPAR